MLTPRTCTICRHEKHQEIDRAIVAGGSMRDIARRFGTSTAALQRHKAEHLPGKLVKAVERQEERHAVSLVDQLDRLTARTQTLLSIVFPEGQNGQVQSISPKDARDVSAVVREVRENLRLTAQLTGQLKGDSATVNVGIVLGSPEWGRVTAAVMGALLPYPEARVAVADALAGLTRGPETVAVVTHESARDGF
jgi:hypothetical protein